MSRAYSSREVIAALNRAGFVRVSQRGSHVKLRATHQGKTWTVIVKDPAGRVPTGTFASILKQAGLTREEFERLV